VKDKCGRSLRINTSFLKKLRIGRQNNIVGEKNESYESSIIVEHYNKMSRQTNQKEYKTRIGRKAVISKKCNL